MTIHRLAALALLTLGLACAGCAKGPRATRSAGASSPAAAALRVLKVSGAEEHAIAPGEHLRNGERVALEVTAARAVYVYVTQATGGGAPTLLHPGGAEEALAPGSKLRLPPKEGFPLEAPTGEEVVHLIVAARPLGDIDRGLCDQFRLPCTATGAAAQSTAAGAPVALADVQCPSLKGGCRAAGATWLGEDNTLFGALDERGVVVMRFAFQHDP